MLSIVIYCAIIVVAFKSNPVRVIVAMCLTPGVMKREAAVGFLE